VIYNIFMPQSRSHQQPQPRPCDPLREAGIEIPVHIFEAGFFKHCAKKSVRDKKTIEHIARSVLSARSTNFVWLNEHNLLERSYKEAIKEDLPKPSKKDPQANPKGKPVATAAKSGPPVGSKPRNLSDLIRSPDGAVRQERSSPIRGADALKDGGDPGKKGGAAASQRGGAEAAYKRGRANGAAESAAALRPLIDALESVLTRFESLLDRKSGDTLAAGGGDAIAPRDAAEPSTKRARTGDGKRDGDLLANPNPTVVRDLPGSTAGAPGSPLTADDFDKRISELGEPLTPRF